MKLSRRFATRLFAAAALTPLRGMLGQSAAEPEFDVASVKPSRLDGWQGIDTMPGRIRADSITLERSIREAYGIGPHRILGGPFDPYRRRPIRHFAQMAMDTLEIAYDHGQQIVEIMCYTPGELADRLDLLRLAQTVMGKLFVGDISTHGVDRAFGQHPGP